MDANPMNLYQLFGQDQRLLVPVFQRPYVWTEDRNWRPMWEDIVSLANRKLAGDQVYPHFLGAVVLDQMQTATGAMPARQVVDGQQRLTTLQVLLAAVRDVVQELEVQAKYVRALVKLTANDDEMTDDPNAVYKVWPTNADRDSFRAVMDGRLRRAVEAVVATGTGDPALVQAYRFFRNRTLGWAQELGYEDRLEEGFDALVRVLREKFELVVIDLKPHDNAQVIFEALNDRGTPLQASDLVKNLVFQMAEEQELPVEALHRDVWSHVETPHWRREVRQGRLKRPALDVFLTQFLTCELAEEVQAPELFLMFRRLLRETGTGLPLLVRHMVDQAAVYQRLTAEEQPETPEGRFLSVLRVLDVNTIVPVLLWLVTRYSEDDRAEAMAALDSYLVRRMVCRLTTKNYNRLFLDLLQELKSKDDPRVVEAFLLRQDAESGFWPRDEDVRYVLRSQPLYKQLTRARLRLVLAELESTSYTGRTERVVHHGKLTIEHLMPQSWEEHWPMPDGHDHSESRELRQALLHTAGNLTLLTRVLNPAISNGPWTQKRSAILLHSALTLNRSLPELWDEASILARADHLFQVFCRRWPRPAGGEAPPSLGIGVGTERRAETPTRAVPRTLGPRRDVAQHIQEAFAGLPQGAQLTVAQIVAVPSSQYRAGEISPGAVAARLRADNVPHVRAVPGSSPLAARKVS
ncbi:DUF262 domain-containing HNH endonuclease family protein [Streptomyces sp. NPDC002734]|uniref:DUF262 domain-containing protein n=1 Tax=Streptomyces sp. NPDC002734 TaxID=3154426 RepID=UPI0033217058